MKYDKIVLIDSYYPYGTAETFLENEIPVLLAQSSQIYIFPTYATAGLNDRLAPIQNVRVFRKSMVRSKAVRAVSAGVTLFSAEVLSEMWKMLRIKKLDFASLKALTTYWAEANYKYRVIKQALSTQIEKGDRVLFYSYWLDTNAYIAGKLKMAFKGSRAISRGHGFDVYLEVHANDYFPLRKKTLEHLDLICPISADGVKYLATHYPWIKDNLCLSRLGTVDHGTKQADQSKTLRIVTCSNMISVKRIDRLIDALALLQEETIEWTHFGGGSLYETLRNRAQKVISGRVSVNFAGAVENSVLMEWYKANPVDVFVNTSESEGIPVSIMEAMSFGIPCIATDVGGTSEIVEDGVNGYLLTSDKNTSSQLAQKLLAIQKQSEQDKLTMRANARETWEEKYNAKKNYTNFYKQILGN